ncbi:MAG TPA: helix-turn-helix domain-containing protein [Gemmatimonadota bacterium]|nr:helix-turn-helix domain-containing protein [Gemmatimonadota bacterium]
MTHDSHFCPRFHKAVELVGRRWTGAILREMVAGGTRFCEIRDAVPDLSDRMLSERLKELEAEGVVEREVYPETPVRIEYRLTEKGRALGRAIESVARWADVWIELEPAAPAAEDVSRQAVTPRLRG